MFSRFLTLLVAIVAVLVITDAARAAQMTYTFEGTIAGVNDTAGLVADAGLVVGSAVSYEVIIDLDAPGFMVSRTGNVTTLDDTADMDRFYAEYVSGSALVPSAGCASSSFGHCFGGSNNTALRHWGYNTLTASPGNESGLIQAGYDDDMNIQFSSNGGSMPSNWTVGSVVTGYSMAYAPIDFNTSHYSSYISNDLTITSIAETIGSSVSAPVMPDSTPTPPPPPAASTPAGTTRGETFAFTDTRPARFAAGPRLAGTSVARTAGGVTGRTRWYDPIVAIGYDYEITGPLTMGSFETVTMATGFGDDIYSLYLYNDLLGEYELTPYATLYGGVTYDFLSMVDPLGVDKFRIMGIETALGIDPNNPLGFPTGLTFTSTDPVNFIMSAIQVDTDSIPAAVPEPSTMLLLCSGLAAIVLVRRIYAKSSNVRMLRV